VEPDINPAEVHPQRVITGIERSGRGFRFGELLGLGRWGLETERQGEEEGLEVGSF